MATKPGEGVDSQGLPVIDPTKNVEDLVKALDATLDKLRTADNKYQDAMREAETRRIDQLAALRVQYDEIIEGMRSTALKDTSMLLATQLRDVKVELADRMSKMEQFRWETGGRGMGQAQIISWVIAGAAVAFAVAVYMLKAVS